MRRPDQNPIEKQGDSEKPDKYNNIKSKTNGFIKAQILRFLMVEYRMYSRDANVVASFHSKC